MPSEITFPSPSGYTETHWTDPNGKQWVADSKGRWSAYKADTGGGSGAWDDITGKPAAVTSLTGTNTGDQDLSGLLTISTAASTYQTQSGMSSYITTAAAASTYAPISTTVTLAGTQTLTNKSISAGQITGLGALATSTDAANLTGNIARARIDNALSANAAPIVATTVTASGAGSFASGTFGNGSADSFLYGPNLRVVANSSGVIIMGSTATLIWSESTPTAAKDIRLRRSAAKTLTVDDNAGGSATLAVTGNLTASGTVTAARYIEGVTALGTVVSSSTITITGGSSVTATLTASTACTFTMPTAAAGLSFVMHLKQAATTGNGSATFTGVVWPGGTAPTITAAAGKMDILSFVAGPNAAGNGYVWYGSAIQNLTPP